MKAKDTTLNENSFMQNFDRREIKDFTTCEHYFYCPHMLNVLKSSNGKITFLTNEVKLLTIQYLQITDAELELKIPSGNSKILHRMGWAVYYLLKLGYLTRVAKSTYKLTSIANNISIADIYNIDWKQQAKNVDSKKNKKEISTNNATQQAQLNNNHYATETEDDTDPSKASWEIELTNYIKKMQPEMFEKFCLEVTKGLGITNIKHTGKTNDKGIDGEGTLVADNFLKYKVGFQFKHYCNSGTTIASSAIREFRGSLANYDIGVFITSSYFSQQAKTEANNDTKITLVDIDALIELCTKNNQFLKPIESYEIVVENILKYTN